jgi:hypothetical protein
MNKICASCPLHKQKKRSNTQNSALHLYFDFISKELNNLGLEFQYQGLKGLDFSIMYTPNIVKEFVWRPIQIALFDKESTTKLTSKEINEIIDVITKFFGERGVYLEFPSIQSLINRNNEK